MLFVSLKEGGTDKWKFCPNYTFYLDISVRVNLLPLKFSYCYATNDARVGVRSSLTANNNVTLETSCECCRFTTKSQFSWLTFFRLIYIEYNKCASLLTLKHHHRVLVSVALVMIIGYRYQ